VLAAHGHGHGMTVARLQPTKLAAMEAHWETRQPAPMYLLTLPNEAKKENYFDLLPIPGLLGFLAYGDFNAEVKGLKELAPLDFAEFQNRTGYDPSLPVAVMPDGTEIVRPMQPEEAMPPVLITFLSFRFMVGMAGLFILLAALAYVWRNSIADRPGFARILAYTIPLPYVTIMAGWVVAEVGRQPWLVYKLMLTTQGISPVPGSSVALSLAAFTVIYGLLGTLAIYLLRRFAIKGPAA
jgi:cytochrome d ubiquinol oxidase subunit I